MDRATFKQLLERGTLLGDGGTGTALVATSVLLPSCVDALNLTSPETVAEVHRSFVAAGAQFVETNTFGANRFKLKAQGLGGQVEEINAAGVRIAREAGARLVCGSIGPLGVRLMPYGRVRPDEARDAFAEQIQVLAAAGADFLLIETQTDLAEAEQAILAARAVSDLPVVVTFTFTRDDRTLLGEGPATVARRLAELDVDAGGVNCSQGPTQVLRLAEIMHAAVPGLPLAAQANAGQPHNLAGRIMYRATPRYLADYAVRLREAGVAVLGGCCGTGPDHIAAMAAALARTPGTEADDSLEETHFEEHGTSVEIIVIGGEGPNELQRSLKSSKTTFVVEMTPPHSSSAARLLAAAETLKAAGATAVSVSDSPMARMRMSPWAACHLIQRDAALPTVLHFPTRGRNLLRIQGDLLASYALGIRNIFVCMGDPTSIGEYPQAADHADVTPSGLIGLIKNGLNEGKDRLGASIGDATDFVAGCAVDPNAHDLDREVKVLHRKIRAGADFAYTQALFSAEPLATFRERYEDQFGELTLPILGGLLPTVSRRHAEFLHNEVPGISIPDEVLERMSASGQPEKEGLEVAVETGVNIAKSAAGIYLIPPFGRYHLAADLIEQLAEAASK